MRPADGVCAANEIGMQMAIVNSQVVIVFKVASLRRENKYWRIANRSTLPTRAHEVNTEI